MPAWHNTPHPEQRVRFWSDIEAELDVVQQTGAEVLRMGVDWGRIVVEEPKNGQQKVKEGGNFGMAKKALRNAIRIKGRVWRACWSAGLPISPASFPYALNHL